jgi:molecular chaperone IbpA
MTTVDFAPLFRTAIGFDRLARLMNTAAASAEAPAYPPYSIEKTGEDTYRLTMAVAGFRPEDLELVVKENTLLISGRVGQETQKAEVGRARGAKAAPHHDRRRPAGRDGADRQRRGD